MRTTLGCLLALLLGCGLSADDKDPAPIDAKRLVGKWRPKGRAAVIEFTKDGKLTITEDGQDSTFEWAYKLDGTKLTLTTAVNGAKEILTFTVLNLTDTELVTRNDLGQERTRVRVKDKK